jgi:hypothetical protein
MVIQSLENIVREELNRYIARRINLNKIDIDVQVGRDIVIANVSNNLFEDQHDTELSTSLLS